MNTEEFNKAREEITDEQLINKTQETLHKLCETGGRSFIMTVPPRIDDTDMIFGELINRYKKAIQVEAKVKPANGDKILIAKTMCEKIINHFEGDKIYAKDPFFECYELAKETLSRLSV